MACSVSRATPNSICKHISLFATLHSTSLKKKPITWLLFYIPPLCLEIRQRAKLVHTSPRALKKQNASVRTGVAPSLRPGLIPKQNCELTLRKALCPIVHDYLMEVLSVFQHVVDVGSQLSCHGHPGDLLAFAPLQPQV